MIGSALRDTNLASLVKRRNRWLRDIVLGRPFAPTLGHLALHDPCIDSRPTQWQSFLDTIAQQTYIHPMVVRVRDHMKLGCGNDSGILGPEYILEEKCVKSIVFPLLHDAMTHKKIPKLPKTGGSFTHKRGYSTPLWCR